MKSMLISFAVDLAVGRRVWTASRQKFRSSTCGSGRFVGMVWGEQLAVRFLVKPPVSSEADAVKVQAINLGPQAEP